MRDDWKTRSDHDEEEAYSARERERNGDPPDGFGPGYFEHCIRTDFANLRRFVGFETAREIVEEIINEAAKGDF